MDTILTLTMNPAVDVSIEIDEMLPEHKLRSRTAQYDPGGGGINVARGIHRCGGKVLALFAGGGPMGTVLEQLIEREGVAHRRLRIAGNTRESLTVQVRRPQTQYRFVLPGPELQTEEVERCLQATLQLSPLPRYWVASGSLPPGAEDFYARLARQAQEHGARLILDTSGPALAKALEQGVYLIKPSKREFAQLVGEEQLDENALRAHSRRIVDKGQAEIVVVSLGGAGALMTTRDEQVLLQPPEVEAVSAVGAGDSFVALMSMKLAAGEPALTALRYGMAAGAAAVMTPGTELFHVEHIEPLYARLAAQSG